jgi:invasion protein IalB
MMRGEIMFNRMSCRRRIALALPVIAAAIIAHRTPAPAQQPAPAAKPAAPKPAAPKPAAAAPAPAPAAPPSIPGAPQPTLLGQFGDWGAYTATPGGKKVCFALAKPATSRTTPPNRPRDPAYMFISSRPAEKVRDEVSIIFGYGLKPNTDANIEISGASYAMYTQADGAWVKNAAEETRLVDAMRKGQDMTVKGTSAKGTASTDVYSLKGLPQALDRVGQECR